MIRGVISCWEGCPLIEQSTLKNIRNKNIADNYAGDIVGGLIFLVNKYGYYKKRSVMYENLFKK